MAKLVLSMQGQMLSEFPIEKERISIGRKADNDIYIDNLAVSGRHAEVVRLFGQYFIEDLNSTNGTFVNGQRITKQVLKDGDVALIGKHELRFSASPGQAPAASADDAPFDRTVLIRAPSFTANPSPTPAPAASAAAAANIHQPPSAPPRPSFGAKVVILSGPDKGKEFVFSKPVTTFGRRGVQVVSVSQRPDGYYITQTEGVTSSMVNGIPIGNRSVLLKEYDLLEVAGTKMTFMVG